MSDLYNLSSHYWDGDVLYLHANTVEGDVFVTIPSNFLRIWGVNTWEYILRLVNMLVTTVAHSACEIYTKEARSVDLSGWQSLGTTFAATQVGDVHLRYDLRRVEGAEKSNSRWQNVHHLSSRRPYYKNGSKTAMTASLASSTTSSNTPSNHTVRLTIRLALADCLSIRALSALHYLSRF